MNILNACVSFFLGRYRKRHWPTNKQPAIKVQTVRMNWSYNLFSVNSVKDFRMPRLMNGKLLCTYVLSDIMPTLSLALDAQIYRACDISIFSNSLILLMYGTFMYINISMAFQGSVFSTGFCLGE